MREVRSVEGGRTYGALGKVDGVESGSQEKLQNIVNQILFSN